MYRKYFNPNERRALTLLTVSALGPGAKYLAGKFVRHLAAGVVLLCLAAVPAGAHPHAWIDVAVQVLFDRNQRISGLREIWLFDEYYTAFAMEEFAARGKAGPTQADVNTFVQKVIANLKEYSYFTEVKSGDTPVALGTVTEMSGELRLSRLVMTFVAPLQIPFDASDAPLTYAVFDPSYYIEMLHIEDKNAIRLDGAPDGCVFDKAKPNPTFEAYSLAIAADMADKPSESLGALFAERVTIRCP